MDEIYASLDYANIYRFNDLLKLIGEKSQIVMITHNKKSMEFADTLFGITMEAKGISKIVSVNFDRPGSQRPTRAQHGINWIYPPEVFGTLNIEQGISNDDFSLRHSVFLVRYSAVQKNGPDPGLIW